MVQVANAFNAVRISLASPSQIRDWSYGEVTRPETINYRTLKPEKDGLFCERIFGPTKDWECYCGKYKKIRYRGVVCDRCGVEVARAKVRRERMGHIELASPVVHIWFLKGTSSRVGLLLDISPRNLEKVVYFAQHIVTDINEDSRKEKIEEIQSEIRSLSANEVKLDEESDDNQNEETDVKSDDKSEDEIVAVEEKASDVKGAKDLQTELLKTITVLQEIKVGTFLTEAKYRELKSIFEGFTAKMGADALMDILKNIDLQSEKTRLIEDMQNAIGQKRKKIIKTLRLLNALQSGENRPEWMILTMLPILPPDLRPMVQLDGGRFATSDLNDLYRRVINRNNRLKRLIDIKAPEVIIRNEKRMLQESVDALVDNGRRGRAVTGSHNHKLKSLSDLLRGKQGRFRQNLLGKRVDYSGRSVITVGPGLQLHECGLPRKMALELFKPFVMNRLILRGYAHNIRSAKRLAEQALPEVYDILEEVVKERPVLLNRAPTLHRLGIQAFQPRLVDGGVIQVHPLVCAAFNADFDGDQMAVHVPLSKEAVFEAQEIMLSQSNLLSPGSGDPIVAPTLDMVLGCYYLTMVDHTIKGEMKSFVSTEELLYLYEMGHVKLHELVKLRLQNGSEKESDWIETTAGRTLFNDVLPKDMPFINHDFDNAALKNLTSTLYKQYGSNITAETLDSVKNLGFDYASKSGTTIAINDVIVPEEKDKVLKKADSKVRTIDSAFNSGKIDELERHNQLVNTWTSANDNLTKIIQEKLNTFGGLYLMATSGARGNISQIKQMAGMRGLMMDPKGRIIPRPIRANFREGLSVLEFFISTHGARKGLADTALRTADSGYLTRRLIDVAQECMVVEEDCGVSIGLEISNKPQTEEFLPTFAERVLGRYLREPVSDPNTAEILVDTDQLITYKNVGIIENSGVSKVLIGSPLFCKSIRGVCCRCYGASLSDWRKIEVGEAVGIIAAQSIGEPGTQLTMRTFHTGGIVDSVDITSGLPRVEELFEARSPKGQAVLSETDGIVTIKEADDGGRSISVVTSQKKTDTYLIKKGYQALVADGEIIEKDAVIAEFIETDENKSKSKTKKTKKSIAKSNILASAGGVVKVRKNKVLVLWYEEAVNEYVIPANYKIIVRNGQKVVVGDSLTFGPKSPQQILSIQGQFAVQQYLVDEVQMVYRSQGVKIHDKHIELIVSRMLKKVSIDEAGDLETLPGELMDQVKFNEMNAQVITEGKEPATATPVLLGITRASLNTDSFLAAASFQETTRVLTEASVNGEVDHLRGLKENVIIGRLIPTRDDFVDKLKALSTVEELEYEDNIDILNSEEEIQNGVVVGLSDNPESSEGPDSEE